MSPEQAVGDPADARSDVRFESMGEVAAALRGSVVAPSAPATLFTFYPLGPDARTKRS